MPQFIPTGDFFNILADWIRSRALGKTTNTWKLKHWSCIQISVISLESYSNFHAMAKKCLFVIETVLHKQSNDLCCKVRQACEITIQYVHNPLRSQTSLWMQGNFHNFKFTLNLSDISQLADEWTMHSKTKEKQQTRSAPSTVLVQRTWVVLNDKTLAWRLEGCRFDTP